jgi:RNA polymerase sigma factor (sigma-70 family)
MIYSDQKLLEGLKEKRTDCIRYMYREYFPLIRSIVFKNSGTIQDVEDIFQDGLIVLYQKARNGDLQLSCSLKTFFFSVCQNLWFARLDRKWRLLYQDNIIHEPSVPYEPEDGGREEETIVKTRICQMHFLSLPEDCQRVLKLFIDRVPLKVIADLMGFKNESYAKTRKYMCKKMLRKRILRDPECCKLFTI